VVGDDAVAAVVAALAVDEVVVEVAEVANLRDALRVAVVEGGVKWSV
jgi:hypothetical protein